MLDVIAMDMMRDAILNMNDNQELQDIVSEDISSEERKQKLHINFQPPRD